MSWRIRIPTSKINKNRSSPRTTIVLSQKVRLFKLMASCFKRWLRSSTRLNKSYHRTQTWSRCSKLRLKVWSRKISSLESSPTRGLKNRWATTTRRLSTWILKWRNALIWRSRMPNFQGRSLSSRKRTMTYSSSWPTKMRSKSSSIKWQKSSRKREKIMNPQRKVSITSRTTCYPPWKSSSMMQRLTHKSSETRMQGSWSKTVISKDPLRTNSSTTKTRTLNSRTKRQKQMSSPSLPWMRTRTCERRSSPSITRST